jgi:hypothetical protein
LQRLLLDKLRLFRKRSEICTYIPKCNICRAFHQLSCFYENKAPKQIPAHAAPLCPHFVAKFRGNSVILRRYCHNVTMVTASGLRGFVAAVTAAILLICCSEATAQETAIPTQAKHFLSVMVIERNQSNLLLEFVRHYLEEGVDHIYIYDGHGAQHLRTELECVDPRFFTIIPSLTNVRSASKLRQKVYDLIRAKTEWLLQVDTDDYISSRSNPEITLRELLETGRHAMCPVIAIPSLNYAWGDTQTTPVGSIRTSLTHRWGYGSEFSSRYNTSIENDEGRFTRGYENVDNRVLFRTDSVESVRTNSAVQAEKGNVCVSSSKEQLRCSLVAAEQPKARTATADSPANPSASGEDNSALLTLPQYCPHHTIYRARRSPSAVHLVEADIPHLSLAGHHYRIPSWQEWRRRARISPHEYQESAVTLANRMDVSDDFMLRRAEARREHPQQRLAERALQRCPVTSGTGADTGAPRSSKGGIEDRGTALRGAPAPPLAVQKPSTEEGAGQKEQQTSATAGDRDDDAGSPRFPALSMLYQAVAWLLGWSKTG